MPNVINLIPAKNTNNTSTKQQLLTWMAHTGRAIIILTESAVLVVFLYRFSLDRQILDTTESIENKKAIVVSKQSLEERVRHTQIQLTSIKKIMSASHRPYDFINLINNVKPEKLTLTGIKTVQNTLILNARTTDPTEFGNLIVHMQNKENVVETTLTEASFIPEDNEYSFTIKFVFKKPYL